MVCIDKYPAFPTLSFTLNFQFININITFYLYSMKNLTPILYGNNSEAGTIENPYDFNSLIKYLSYKHNTSGYHKILLNDINDYKDHNIKLSTLRIIIGNTTWRVSGCYSTGKNYKKLKIYRDDIYTEVPMNGKFEQVFYLKRKHLEEFPSDIKKIGKYNYSEGDGWYTKRQLYEVDGLVFVNV